MIATTRSGTWRGTDPPGVEIELRAFDIVSSSEPALIALLSEVEAAVFCFAPSADQDRSALYAGGAARIAAASRKSGLRRVVYTSSTSAIGDHDGWVDETFEEWPRAPRGRIQREAEEALSTGLQDTNVAWTILRLAGLYGPDRELERLYRVADTDRVRPGDGSAPTNLIHLDDAVQAVLAALDRPLAESTVIQVCDDDHRTRREVAADVARKHGYGAPRWEEPASPEPHGKRVSNARMKQRLEVDLRHPDHLA